MLRYRIEQCYDGAPRPLGSPLLMSRNHLVELLREQVARGRAGRAAAESSGILTGDRSVARPTPPPEDVTDGFPVSQQLPVKGPPPSALDARMPVGKPMGKKPPPPRAPRVAPAAPLAPVPEVQGTLPSPRGPDGGPDASHDPYVRFRYINWVRPITLFTTFRRPPRWRGVVVIGLMTRRRMKMASAAEKMVVRITVRTVTSSMRS